MKEMQLRTTSSLRALLKTEPLLPMMDTETQSGEESVGISVLMFCERQNILSHIKDTFSQRPVKLNLSMKERTLNSPIETIESGEQQ